MPSKKYRLASTIKQIKLIMCPVFGIYYLKDNFSVLQIWDVINLTVHMEYKMHDKWKKESRFYA